MRCTSFVPSGLYFVIFVSSIFLPSMSFSFFSTVSPVSYPSLNWREEMN